MKNAARRAAKIFRTKFLYVPENEKKTLVGDTGPILIYFRVHNICSGFLIQKHVFDVHSMIHGKFRKPFLFQHIVCYVILEKQQDEHKYMFLYETKLTITMFIET